MIRRASDRHDEQSGAIAIMAAVMLLASLLATSLAVDVGRAAFVSRDLQGVTDRAALDALVPVSKGSMSLSDLYADVVGSIDDTLARNPGTSNGTASGRAVHAIGLGRVEQGLFVAVCDDDPNSPAVSCTVASGSPGDVTAVLVETFSRVPFVFALGDVDGGRDVYKRAVAETQAVAAIAVGSRLVELDLNESPVFEPMLGALLSPLGVTSLPALTAVGYDGLVTASVPLGDLLSLDATLLDQDSVVDGVDAKVLPARDFLQVVADGLHTGDPSAEAEARTFLLALKEQIPAAETVDLGELLWVTTEDPSAAASAEVNVFDLVMGALQVANGDNAVVLDLASTDLGAMTGLLGFELLDFDLHLDIVESPRIAIGPARFIPADENGDGIAGPDEGRWQTSARTAQIDLTLSLDVKANVVDDLLGPVLDLVDDLLGGLTCGLLGLCPTETLTVSLSGAEAVADLTSIDCADPLTNSALGVDVATQTATLALNGRDLFTELGLSDSPWSGHITPVPGEAIVPPDSPLPIPLVGDILRPLFGLLGLDLGTAEARGLSVDCSTRRLTPLSTAPSGP